MFFDIFTIFDIWYSRNNIEDLFGTDLTLNDILDVCLQLQSGEHGNDERLCNGNNLINFVWLVSAWIGNLLFNKYGSDIIAVNKESENADSNYKIEERANMTSLVRYFITFVRSFIILRDDVLLLCERDYQFEGMETFLCVPTKFGDRLQLLILV